MGYWARTKLWLQHHKETSPVLAAVLALMSGTGIAQVITFILQIFIARIYSDYDKGLFGVYGTITGFIITFAALRFDLTIVLPKKGVVARVLKKLATRCVIVSSMLTSAFCIIFSKWLEENYHHSEALSKWLMISGMTVFIVAELTNVQYWLIRQERFGAIAMNSIVQSLSTAGMQLLLGVILKGGLTGLIIGTMTGQLITLVLLSLRAPELWKKIPADAPSMLEVAKRYKKMPLLNAPNVLVDSIRNMGINLLIGAASIAALGQFQLAWAIMEVPVGLIAGSISQVFLKKLSAANPGEMLPLVKSTLWRVAIVAAIPFTLLFILAPWLFPFVFGDQWGPAGHFGRAITPWLYMTVLTSPISNIFVVTDNQQRMLIFSIFYSAVPLTWLFLSKMELLPKVYVLGGLMAAMLVVMIVLSLWCAKEYDARDINPAEVG
ncbi:hypothetical protein [Propionimicrobium lymphophilum]|uniref:hypothetical protein n=1 Tax=Propionimicrobium lymphophilum TaxID=33012 RepID=UPI003EC79723